MSAPRKIWFAIPSQTDNVKVMTCESIADALIGCLFEGWTYVLKGYAGITPISNSRNFALAEFLASDCTDMFFWDDDVACERGAPVRILKHAADLVLGVYPYRADPIGFPVRYLAKADFLVADPATGLLEIEGGGFGFTRITRRCAQALWDSCAHLEYYEKGAPGEKCRMVFQLNTFVDGVPYSEDMLFCRRWRDLGGSVWADPELTFVHIGNKGFAGKFGDWLRERNGLQSPAAASAA